MQDWRYETEAGRGRINILSERLDVMGRRREFGSRRAVVREPP